MRKLFNRYILRLDWWAHKHHHNWKWLCRLVDGQLDKFDKGSLGEPVYARALVTKYSEGAWIVLPDDT